MKSTKKRGPGQSESQEEPSSVPARHIDARRWYAYAKTRTERAEQLLIADAIRGFADIAGGRVFSADAAIDQLQQKRAGFGPKGTL